MWQLPPTGVWRLRRRAQGSRDLVVLDIMLPGLDSYEVCRILRQEINVPILMLTAGHGKSNR